MVDDVPVSETPRRRPERYPIDPLSGLVSNTDKPLIYFIDGQVRQYIRKSRCRSLSGPMATPRPERGRNCPRGEARQNLRVRDSRHGLAEDLHLQHQHHA